MQPNVSTASRAASWVRMVAAVVPRVALAAIGAHALLRPPPTALAQAEVARDRALGTGPGGALVEGADLARPGVIWGTAVSGDKERDRQ